MRILFVSATESSPVARELSELGHEVIEVRPSGRRSLRECVRRRPDIAYLRADSFRTAAVLVGLRVPYVVELDRPIDRPLIVRAARAVIAPTEELAHFAVNSLGANEASIIPPGVDLDEMAPGDREEAKQRLNLQPGLRIATMIGSLDRELRLDVLAEAHRKLSGTGLLIVGEGEQESFVQAMRAATRPSSPVIFLGARPRAEELLAIRAAEVCVSLGGGDAGYAACGRRQVALRGPESERLEALESEAVQVVESTPIAMRAALERAIEAGDLPREEVERIRDLLSWKYVARQVAQVLEENAA